MSDTNTAARVAVIAVHGVADQEREDSASAIARLLLNLQSSDEPCYGTFKQVGLAIPVRPVVVSGMQTCPLPPSDGDTPSAGDNPKCPKAAGTTAATYRSFHGQTQLLHRIARKRRDEAWRTAGHPQQQGQSAQNMVDPAPREPDAGILFTRTALGGYVAEGPAATYQTVRLEGMRRPVDDLSLTAVHVYELYWADLSRLGRGVLRLLGELYQILLHLCSVGVHTVDAASVRNIRQSDEIKCNDVERIRRRWQSYSTLQRIAAWFLRVPIPILNLLMLAVSALMVAANIPNWMLTPTAAFCVSAIAGAAIVLAIRQSKRVPAIAWYLAPVAFLLIVAGLAWFVFRNWGVSPGGRWEYFARLAVIVVVTGAVVPLVAFILRGYARRSPGTGQFSTIAGSLVLIGGVVLLVVQTTRGWSSGLTDSSKMLVLLGVTVIESLYLYLLCAWVGFYGLAWGAGIEGWRARRAMRTVSTDAFERARRVNWTARLTLALPALLFILVTCVLWSALSGVVGPLLGFDQILTEPTVLNLLAREAYLPNPTAKDVPVSSYMLALVPAAVGSAFPIVVLLLIAAVLLFTWGLGPIAMMEVSPPRVSGTRAKEASVVYGHWLTRSFFLARGAGELLYWSLMLLLPGGFILDLVLSYSGLSHRLWPQVVAYTHQIFNILGPVALVILTMRGRLDVLNLGFRPIIDVALDIDNHLREHPVQSNRRAAIAARYVSLLRYLCAWRDTDGRGYDAIVIVAHSQGSVITADLLRYLHRKEEGRDPALSRILDRQQLPVYLFTMGCPLRQIYSIRFPHLYLWIREADDKQRYQNDAALRAIPRTRMPDPQELGLQQWVNAYRAGDYVGRWLWRSDPCGHEASLVLDGPCPHPWNVHQPLQNVVDDRFEDQSITRRELCIGPGAHTHYWDDTAPEIAIELDRLIRLGRDRATLVRLTENVDGSIGQIEPGPKDVTDAGKEIESVPDVS